ncbi:MAG: hypothetical protein AAF557_14025 [Pseudomonadota bacterium]
MISIVIAGLGLLYMLAYIYLPEDELDTRPIPPELLCDDHQVDDPFRSPDDMRQKLEDFGRFNVRYNEADGVFPGLPFLLRFVRWWRR